MAKIKVAGNALVVESSKKFDEIKLLEKYRPNALVLFEEDGKTEKFRVGTTKGEGSIGKYGASFGGAAKDNSGKAVITMMMPEGVTDAKEYAEDVIGVAIILLNKVEEQFASALEEVNAEKAKVRESIELV